jgi:Predicted membrane protein (DUF2238)
MQLLARCLPHRARLVSCQSPRLFHLDFRSRAGACRARDLGGDLRLVSFDAAGLHSYSHSLLRPICRRRYTYAQVDTFKMVREFFGWQRNNYDKVGHFSQGFVPAIIAREILIRNDVVSSRGWLNFFVISVCLAFSALYELFEWIVAILASDSAENFLATQGYAWDTQSDMAMALWARFWR